jgi:hypothetical protein
MVAGVVSLVLSLWLGGFIIYQWVLAWEATVASVALFVFGVRDYLRGTRRSKWPPLLPLAVIGAAGGAKSAYVASDRDTPLLVILVLFAGVLWLAVASWQMLRAGRRP